MSTSTNGQNILNTSSDLIEIIKACGASGVEKIKIGDLEIQFKGQQVPDYLTIFPQNLNNSTRSVPDNASDNDAIDKDEELVQKLLTDPLAYEELVDVE